MTLSDQLHAYTLLTSILSAISSIAILSSPSPQFITFHSPSHTHSPSIPWTSTNLSPHPLREECSPPWSPYVRATWSNIPQRLRTMRLWWWTERYMVRPTDLSLLNRLGLFLFFINLQMSSSTTWNYFLSHPYLSTHHYFALSSLSSPLIELGALSRQQRMAVKLRASEKRWVHQSVTAFARKEFRTYVSIDRYSFDGKNKIMTRLITSLSLSLPFLEFSSWPSSLWQMNCPSSPP